MFAFAKKPTSPAAQPNGPKPAVQPAAKASPEVPLFLQLIMSNATRGASSARAAAAGGADESPGGRFGPLFPVAAAPAIQRKAAISAPGDASEREADDVAEKVMRMAEPGPIGTASAGIHRACAKCSEEETNSPAPAVIQRACAKCDEENDNPTIQTKHAPSGAAVAGMDTGAAVSATTQGGAPLSAAARGFFEPRFGRDFSQVQVHTSSAAADAARSVQARAYTLGSHIVFGAGQYSPDTTEGRRLIAHELSHVVQAGGSSGFIQRATSVVSSASPSSPAEVCFVHLHNDEQVALATAQSLRTANATRGAYCANMVNLTGNSGRPIDTGGGCSADPNRIFTPRGIRRKITSTACRNRAWDFVNRDLGPAIVACTGGSNSQLSSATGSRRHRRPLPMTFGPLPIIAFHNNTVGTPTTVGAGTAADPGTFPSGQFDTFRTTNTNRTPDDLILVTEHADFTTLTGPQDENVVEQLGPADDDGSLSIAARGARYFNIEVQQPAGGRGGGSRTFAQAQSVEEAMAVTILNAIPATPCTPATGSGTTGSTTGTGGSTTGTSGSTTGTGGSTTGTGSSTTGTPDAGVDSGTVHRKVDDASAAPQAVPIIQRTPESTIHRIPNLDDLPIPGSRGPSREAQEQMRRGLPLPYREATELSECLRIMNSQEYCYQAVLGIQPPPPPAWANVSPEFLTGRSAAGSSDEQVREDIERTVIAAFDAMNDYYTNTWLPDQRRTRATAVATLPNTLTRESHTRLFSRRVTTAGRIGRGTPQASIMSGELASLTATSTPAQIEAAIRTAMRTRSMPGFSRHHWGTDIDVASATRTDWVRPSGSLVELIPFLEQHAPRFGFHHPFSQASASSTGFPSATQSHYLEEPWHLSYSRIAQSLQAQWAAQFTGGPTQQANLAALIQDVATAVHGRVPIATMQAVLAGMNLEEFQTNVGGPPP